MTPSLQPLTAPVWGRSLSVVREPTSPPVGPERERGREEKKQGIQK